MSTYGCGFTDSTRVIEPVTVTRLVTSNIVCAAWCAHAGMTVAASALSLGFASPMSWVWAVIDVSTIDSDEQGIKFRS